MGSPQENVTLLQRSISLHRQKQLAQFNELDIHAPQKIFEFHLENVKLLQDIRSPGRRGQLFSLLELEFTQTPHLELPQFN